MSREKVARVPSRFLVRSSRFLVIWGGHVAARRRRAVVGYWFLVVWWSAPRAARGVFAAGKRLEKGDRGGVGVRFRDLPVVEYPHAPAA